jgi:hypothetical protein
MIINSVERMSCIMRRQVILPKAASTDHRLRKQTSVGSRRGCCIGRGISLVCDTAVVCACWGLIELHMTSLGVSSCFCVFVPYDVFAFSTMVRSPWMLPDGPGLTREVQSDMVLLSSNIYVHFHVVAFSPIVHQCMHGF